MRLPINMQIWGWSTYITAVEALICGSSCVCSGYVTACTVSHTPHVCRDIFTCVDSFEMVWSIELFLTHFTSLGTFTCADPHVSFTLTLSIQLFPRHFTSVGISSVWILMCVLRLREWLHCFWHISHLYAHVCVMDHHVSFEISWHIELFPHTPRICRDIHLYGPRMFLETEWCIESFPLASLL